MSTPERVDDFEPIGDLAAAFLAHLWHQGDPMTHSPEQRAAGAQALACGKATHPYQDDDGDWYDVPCDCRGRPLDGADDREGAVR